MHLQVQADTGHSVWSLKQIREGQFELEEHAAEQQSVAVSHCSSRHFCMFLEPFVLQIFAVKKFFHADIKTGILSPTLIICFQIISTVKAF